MDVLTSLEEGLHCNSFSSRGKRQKEEVDRFKRAICTEEQQEPFEHFAQKLVQMISGCITKPCRSIDTRRERSYRMLYKARIAGLNELWNDFHSELTLPQPNPIWT